MEPKFRRLIDEFCDFTGLEEPDAIAEGTSFNVDEVECAVIYQSYIAPEHIHCYIDFGHPPGDQLDVVYDHLLKANYLQFASTKSNFSLSPHTGHVILMTVIPLSEATGKMLVDQLAHYAQQALSWRNTYLLADPGAIDPMLVNTNRMPYP